MPFDPSFQRAQQEYDDQVPDWYDEEEVDETEGEESEEEDENDNSPTKGWTEEDWDNYYAESARSRETNMER